MITNTSLTLYNQWADKEKGVIKYVRTVIEDVSWYLKQKTTVADNGLQSADSYEIRIPEESEPEDKSYIDPDEFINLTKEDVDKYWTIRKDDLFAKGVLDTEIESMEELSNSCSYAGIVMSTSDNRIGLNPHWQIGGA